MLILHIFSFQGRICASIYDTIQIWNTQDLRKYTNTNNNLDRKINDKIIFYLNLVFNLYYQLKYM